MSQKYILRRNNIDTEEDKYSYYVSCTKGVEVTTPFKDKASIFEEEDRIDTISKDWEFIKVYKKAIKMRPQYDDNKTLRS